MSQEQMLYRQGAGVYVDGQDGGWGDITKYQHSTVWLSCMHFPLITSKSILSCEHIQINDSYKKFEMEIQYSSKPPYEVYSLSES